MRKYKWSSGVIGIVTVALMFGLLTGCAITKKIDLTKEIVEETATVNDTNDTVLEDKEASEPALGNEGEPETVENQETLEKQEASDGADAKISPEIRFAETIQKSSEYETSLLNDDLSQQEMNQKMQAVYDLWDQELNQVWSTLEGQLDTSDMEALRIQEREWIDYKEQEMNQAGAEFEGGTMQPYIKALKGAELTKLRVYELAELLE